MSTGEITNELTLTLTGGEIASLIEASHTALCKRLQWSVLLDSPWRRLDFAYARQMITDLELGYTKLYLAFRQLLHVNDSFERSFAIPDDVYALIDTIKDGDKWEDVDTHRHAPSLCRLCKTLYRVI